jgi:hypothetical protein
MMPSMIKGDVIHYTREANLVALEGVSISKDDDSSDRIPAPLNGGIYLHIAKLAIEEGDDDQDA